MAENRKASAMVTIWSTGDSVSHVPQTDPREPKWLWKRNPYEKECTQDVKRRLLEAEIKKCIGLRRALEDGTLFVKDVDIIEKFNLPELGEYIKDKDELKEFVLTSSNDELEDFLQYAPDTMLQNIETIFTETELNSRSKIKLIKEYTGVDLEEFYKDMDEEGVKLEEVVQQKQATKGKQSQARKKVTE